MPWARERGRGPAARPGPPSSRAPRPPEPTPGSPACSPPARSLPSAPAPSPPSHPPSATRSARPPTGSRRSRPARSRPGRRARRGRPSRAPARARAPAAAAPRAATRSTVDREHGVVGRGDGPLDDEPGGRRRLRWLAHAQSRDSYRMPRFVARDATRRRRPPHPEPEFQGRDTRRHGTSHASRADSPCTARCLDAEEPIAQLGEQPLLETSRTRAAPAGGSRRTA